MNVWYIIHIRVLVIKVIVNKEGKSCNRMCLSYGIDGYCSLLRRLNDRIREVYQTQAQELVIKSPGTFYVTLQHT